ncbi:hypothetical protein D9M70_574970 [compost metagenome]
MRGVGALIHVEETPVDLDRLLIGILEGGFLFDLLNHRRRFKAEQLRRLEHPHEVNMPISQPPDMHI